VLSIGKGKFHLSLLSKGSVYCPMITNSNYIIEYMNNPEHQ
jgi:hypothetical protein